MNNTISARKIRKNRFETDMLGGFSDELGSQLFGKEEPQKQHKTSGELKPGEEFDPFKILRETIAPQDTKQERTHEQKSNPNTIEPLLDYRREIMNFDTIKNKRETEGLKVKLEEIQIELKKITQSSRELETEFKEVTIEQRIETPGTYHVNFLEWVLSVIREVRLRVEDSASWLAMFRSKKDKKQYWSQAKKHGTTFSLSNERTVATQTG